jgi:hypothetical protein
VKSMRMAFDSVPIAPIIRVGFSSPPVSVS